MTDDWTWDDGHGDHSGLGGHDDPGGHEGFEHHDLGGHDEPDPFDADLGQPHDTPFGDDHHEYEGDDEPFDAGTPFEPDALVSEHHDWLAGFDDGTDGGDDLPDTVEDPVGAGLFGVDPDVAAYTGGVWPTAEFPAALDLGGAPPEPIDGPPWTDPGVLGTVMPDFEPDVAPAPEIGDLASYAGLEPGAGWDALAASDDPATAALARFWGPQS
jgi:hypothetical protein